jgi:hypothetical protein
LTTFDGCRIRSLQFSVAERETGRVLGVHVMTEDAGAIWSGLALAVRFTPFSARLLGRAGTDHQPCHVLLLATP